MKKLWLLLFMATLSINLAAKGPQSKMSEDKREEIAAQMREFQQQAVEKRKNLLNEIYQLRLDHLKDQHQRELKLLDTIAEKQREFKPGDRSHNKQIRAEIKQLRQNFRKERKLRQQELREKIKKMRQDFQKEQKEARRGLRAKFK